ncbi:1982_t:CDS:10, partial [Ambispora leptoticha]
MSSTTAEQGVAVNTTSVAPFCVQPVTTTNTSIIHPAASEEAVTTTANNDSSITTNPSSSDVNLASNSTVPVPPSVQLLKIHEEQATAAQKTDVSVIAETLSTAVNTVRGSNSTTVYDETDTKNWPSLSATSAPIKSSSVWGSRSGAELVRQAAQPATPVGVVGDRNITNSASTPFTGVQPMQQPLLKSAGIITKVVELSAAQQSQKREFGFKTATSDIVKRIKEKTNTQIQVSTANVSGTTTFLIKGKEDDVMRAKREILSNFALKMETQIQIPVSVRRFILGAGGETLKSISLRTGTRIQLPPRQEEHHEEKTSELDYDDDEEQMTITIEGDEEGIDLAKANIEAIVNEKTSKKTVKITDIEHHFYPLIAGAHGQRLQQLQQESGAKIRIPPYIVSFENDGHEGNNNTRDNCIVVSGERDAVRKAIEMLKDRHEELKSTTTTTKTNVPKRQHKYLIGPKGANLQEILESTECSIELSPPSDPSEEVIIRGPSRNHWKAMHAVSEKANSIHVETLDIANIHKTENPNEHARNVLKYLWNRSKLRKIEAETGIQIMAPRGSSLDKGVLLEFVGKVVSDVEKARKEVMELVKNLSPSSFTIVSIEPHLHRHIIGRKGQNLQRVKETYGVEIIVPDEKDESPDILIVFEGKEDDEIPTEKKKKEAYVKEVLEKAKQELIKAGQDASDFATQTLTIPVRFHRYIIGPRGVTLNAITGGSDAPVSVKFGSSRTGAAERSANAEGKKATTIPISDDIVVIKGPTEEVNRVVKEITKVVEDAKHVEIMNSYTIDFTFPAQYSAHVIGKGGSHVTRLKENLNVKIDIEGGAKGEEKKTHPGENVKVTIQGRKDNVEEAKAKILDLVDKLQDATILRLQVPVEYHKSLIGVGGRYVKRLEEKYGVHIRFPKNKESTEDVEDDVEAQKFDEVIIKGGRRGAADAKAEMMELLDYEREHDNSLNFTIPAIYLPHVVGRGGAKITEIKNDTFTRIDLGHAEPSPDNPDEQIVNVVIHGTKDDIIKAKEAILQIVRELESQTTITINIDPQHHKYLIGPGGSRIREIVAKAGGPDEKSSQAGIVKFPRHGSNSDEVILKGDKNVVEKVKIELEKLVEEQNNLVVDLIEIPRIQHSQIIGRNGASLKDLQHRFDVEIQFPGSRGYNDTHLSGDVKMEIEECDAVKIIGKKENIMAAKTEILSKIRHFHTVNVPRKYHCAIAANGITVRKLRNDYGVLVDHGNEIPPEAKPQMKKPNGNGIAKRIDEEDENFDEDFVGEMDWELVENDDNEEEGEIPWNLKGEKKQVERAEKYINDLLDEARNFTHTAFFTVPQHLHRHIIGRGGATIQRIRNESGCRIDVPKSNDDETVIVTGSLTGVEEARTLMLETNTAKSILANKNSTRPYDLIMSEQKFLTRPPTDQELFNFKFIRILSEDPRTKTINVLGSLPVNINEATLSDDDSTDYAILLLEKTHFHNEEVANLSRERVEKWILHESNDIYHRYFGTTKTRENLPDFQVTIIWPATETHVQKYSLQPRHLINETPSIYQQVVKPFIESIPASRIEWVYNILSKKKEAEKILLEEENDENGFILLPDILYLIAIVHRRDICSIRDLNQIHLPLLRGLKRKILEFVPNRFPGVSADELRLFVHYQPSYYHFHLHVTHICQDSIPGGIAAEKAHLLDTIIDNIANIANDYYQRATLTYIIGENETLFEPLTEVNARVKAADSL